MKELNSSSMLYNRGVKDLLIACIDGLKGFSDVYTENLNSAIYCTYGTQY